MPDFFTKDVLDAARMLYEGGAYSYGYYHTYKVEMDAYFLVGNVYSVKQRNGFISSQRAL
ncbi:hypothetical protein BA724_03770 [Domibacillus iocasae]|uniref:Uncharacterized protein n=1 Tax=Domibacillus iocasae TaxID=1714016 RepID=A0A1E7DPX0_9BACI|nr:hypothetical protein BA724_03770 [Domibacillus iocasae]